MAATAAGFTKAIIAVPVTFAIMIVFVSHRLRRESWRDIGFRLDNFVKALLLLAPLVVVTALLCLLIGWRLGTQVNFLRWHPNRYLLLQFAIGFFWALA